MKFPIAETNISLRGCNQHTGYWLLEKAKFSAASDKSNTSLNNYDLCYLNDLNIKIQKQRNGWKLVFLLVFINCCKGVIGAFKRATKRLQHWFLDCGFQGQEPRLPGQHGQEVLKWEANVPWRFGNRRCLMEIMCYDRELEAAAQQTFGEWKRHAP